MVKFNELTINISPVKELVIDASVFTNTAYTNVYIKNIYVLNLDTFNPVSISGCLSKAAYQKTYTEASKTKTAKLNLTELQLILRLYSIDLSSDMVFVVIDCYGAPSVQVACGMDNTYTVGVAFDLCKYYNSIMNTIKELNNTCDIPRNLIDKFLQFLALKTSIITSNYQEAINLYNKYYVNINNSNNNVNTCSCHG